MKPPDVDGHRAKQAHFTAGSESQYLKTCWPLNEAPNRRKRTATDHTKACNWSLVRTSSVRLKPIMRFDFSPLCSLLLGASTLCAQESAPPAFSAQPGNVAAILGAPATLSVRIEGTPTPTLLWFKSGQPIPGTTSPTLTFPAVAFADAATYYVVATNPAGFAISASATLTVNKQPQTLTFTPANTVTSTQASLTLAASSSAELPVTLTILTGAAALTGNRLSGSGGPVIIRASQAGNATIAAAVPIERTFTFIAGATAPFITAGPTDQTITAGTALTLSASSLGLPAPTYQWQKDGVTLLPATTTTLTIPATSLTDAGRYTVTATNFLGASTASATLIVRAPPIFTLLPTNQTARLGAAVTFTTAASGFPVPSFQWRKNGTLLAGATNASLIITSAATADAARYEVVATNSLASVTSPVATLSLNTTNRDFSGTYFGSISTTTPATTSTGEFALLVRANRTAVFLAHLPALSAGITLLDLTVDATGNFARSISIGPRSASLRGAVDDLTGEVNGTLSEIGLAWRGARATTTGSPSPATGFYQAALIGTAANRGFILVGPNGRAFVLTANGSTTDSASGNLGTNGRLTLTTTTQASLDLGFSSGALTGTVRAGTLTGTLAGTNEALFGTEHLVNLSVRSTTATTSPLIVGFVVNGTSAKQLLLRAAGPALAAAPFNVAGTLNDPNLQLYRGSNLAGQNDNWGNPAPNITTLSAATTAAGAFPFQNNSNDAALLTSLTPGPYTVIIGGGNGITLAEIYEALEPNETGGTRRLVNLSARGVVTPGAPLIAGFVITGRGPQRVLIRGIGPSLGSAPFNVANALGNPQLTLFRGNAVVKNNDDWFRDPEATLIRSTSVAVGAFPLGDQSTDAAILIFLEPGAYTAQVSGPSSNANATNDTGLALVEVYEASP
ncbi:MAG: hypothetical protein RL077_1306 [Verrucomicrobiota bacterium]